MDKEKSMSVHDGYPGVALGKLTINTDSEYKILILNYDHNGPIFEKILPECCMDPHRTIVIGYQVSDGVGFDLYVVIQESAVILERGNPLNGLLVTKDIHEFSIKLNAQERVLVEAIFEGGVDPFSEFACISIDSIFWKYVLKNPKRDKYKFYKFFPGFSNEWARKESKETLSILKSTFEK